MKAKSESQTAANSSRKVHEEATKQASAAPPEPPRLLTSSDTSTSSRVSPVGSDYSGLGSYFCSFLTRVTSDVTCSQPSVNNLKSTVLLLLIQNYKNKIVWNWDVNLL